jgi:selenocysteine lyase/cysteine desulfurase
MTTLISCQRYLFEIPDDVAYLNCAYTAPLLRAASLAGRRALEQKSAPWTLTVNHFFEHLEENRRLFGRLIGAPADHVAIIPSASYGMALAARNLPVDRGQSIVLLQNQFPSNVYAWQRLAVSKGARIVTVKRPDDHDWTAAVLERIDPGTAVVALPNCHWTDGTLLDLVAIGAKCRRLRAALVLDLTQSLGAMPFSVADVQPDFLVAAAHKWLLGPYSYGYCYVAPRWQEGIPLEENWLNRENSQDFARLVDYRSDYQPGARRFDTGGASNFILAPIASAALNQILRWGVANIAASLGQITDVIAERAEQMGLTMAPPSQRAPHMIGLGVPAGVPEHLLSVLSQHRVYISIRGDSLRVAPHLFTSESDIERLFEALVHI